jgi:tRNA pseudouridine65 synthase
MHVDTRIVVVDKPSGWVVHPVGPDSEAPDLLSWLSDQDVPGQLAPAHRLDLGTSGVMIFATPKSSADLAALFADGQV